MEMTRDELNMVNAIKDEMENIIETRRIARAQHDDEIALLKVFIETVGQKIRNRIEQYPHHYRFIVQISERDFHDFEDILDYLHSHDVNKTINEIVKEFNANIVVDIIDDSIILQLTFDE